MADLVLLLMAASMDWYVPLTDHGVYCYAFEL